MIVRAFASAACLLLAALGAAHAAPLSCENVWKSLPVLSPDPEYESPNDPDLVYRDRVVRLRSPYGIWAQELNKASQNFVQMRGMLATWSNQLAAAERNFWQDFDSDGKVTQNSVNELAYWLHKREVWSVVRYNMITSVNDQAGGALKVLFGDGELSFLPPGEFPPGSPPEPAADIEKSFADATYRAYMGKLQQMSFLRLSACAPARSGTPSGRVLQDILYPYYNVSYVSAFWTTVQDWAAAGPGRMEQLDTLLSDLTPQQKLDRDSVNIISDVMSGKSSSAKDVQYERYSELVQRVRVMGFVFLNAPQTSKTGFSVSYTDQNAMPRGAVVINGATLDEAKTCVKDNWEMIRKYYFDQTSEIGMQAMLNPTMGSIQYQKHLGYAALIACGSADGLDDARVSEMIAPYANRKSVSAETQRAPVRREAPR